MSKLLGVDDGVEDGGVGLEVDRFLGALLDDGRSQSRRSEDGDVLEALQTDGVTA